MDFVKYRRKGKAVAKVELYLVRHGETVWNKEGRYYGHADIGLSEDGRKQAKELGIYFRQIKFDKVIVSPLIRAVDTAKELTDVVLHEDERLMEQNFGLFEGKTYQELKDEFSNELTRWNEDYQNYCLPNGESFTMVRKRVEEFAQDLWKEQGRVLLVAHKGTFGHLLASLLKMPPEGYWNFVFEQGTYTKIALEDGFAILRAINKLPPSNTK